MNTFAKAAVARFGAAVANFSHVAQTHKVPPTRDVGLFIIGAAWASLAVAEQAAVLADKDANAEYRRIVAAMGHGVAYFEGTPAPESAPESASASEAAESGLEVVSALFDNNANDHTRPRRTVH